MRDITLFSQELISLTLKAYIGLNCNSKGEGRKVAITHYCQARPSQQQAILDPVPTCVLWPRAPPRAPSPNHRPHSYSSPPACPPLTPSPTYVTTRCTTFSVSPPRAPACHARPCPVRRRTFCGPEGGWNRGMSLSSRPLNGMPPPAEEEGRVKGGGWVAAFGNLRSC